MTLTTSYQLFGNNPVLKMIYWQGLKDIKKFLKGPQKYFYLEIK